MEYKTQDEKEVTSYMDYKQKKLTNINEEEGTVEEDNKG